MPETVDGIPSISGSEEVIRAVMRRPREQQHLASGIDFRRIRSGFACALHMHQPLIPAGGADPGTAPIISNLKHMMDHPNDGDNHNASVFHWCYKRMGEFIPTLVREGKQPRIMLEYSGTLLHGLRDMGLADVFDALVPLARNPDYARCVEWLGAPWGHAVAPSTPVQDFRLHVQAFQHHFAAIFGFAALERLRGFSPSEMALPNHPDVAYDFVKTLRDCGYRWVLVQEHTVERAEDGAALRDKHIPHRLVVRSSQGECTSIVAIIKTQGSDTKLVAQMQPYYEAKSVGATELAGKRIPRLVTQIADGENGGVMMNEFPPKFMEVMREASGSEVPPLNVSEYLDYLESIGLSDGDFPAIQSDFPPPPVATLSGWLGAGETCPGHRRAEEGRCTISRRGRIVDQQHFVGARLRRRPAADGARQRLVFRENTERSFYQQRPLPERPLSPAGRRNLVLPLLGPGYLDRLWTRARRAGDPDRTERGLAYDGMSNASQLRTEYNSVVSNISWLLLPGESPGNLCRIHCRISSALLMLSQEATT